MANVGYHYREHTDIAFTPVTADVAIDAGSSWTVTLLDERYPGGILGGEPFLTSYEGFIYTDVSSGTYELSIVVEHSIGEIRFSSPARSAQVRIGNAVDYAWPLSQFDTQTVVQLGSYTTSDGETIEITDELLAMPARITVTASLRLTDDSAFTLMLARSDEAAVTFWQLQPELEDGSVSLDHLAAAVAARLLPEAEETTRGFFVRQAEEDETFELVAGGPDNSDGGMAYATWEQYQARNTTNADHETAVTDLLPAISRLVDRRLYMMPGGFAPMNGATFYFTGQGRRTLRLRDSEGAAYPLRSVAAGGIRPDYDRTGDYDNVAQQWDLDDAWIWPRPRDADAIGRPYRSLELRRISGAPFTIWPYSDGGVRITGDWGWAATPGMIRELVIAWTRDTLDGHQGGLASVVDGMDQPIMLGGDTWRLWNMVQAEYRTKQNVIGVRS